MKKILVLGIIILSIFIIYLTMLDKKVYYLTLGDEIALGLTSNDYYEKNYTDYVKEYLQEKKLLEKHISEYTTQGYRITDIINDIENNKEIEDTKITIKNALIKSDLVTLSIGTNDIISKIEDIKKINNIDYNKIKKNIESISKDLEKLLKEIREYCKEDIILIGIYINTENDKINEIIKQANDRFESIAIKYKVKYIDLYELLSSKEYAYPNKEDQKIIGENIIGIINNNLLNK
jgi:lysophospholipase L1-like esterase